jgi:hypothetical protein
MWQEYFINANLYGFEYNQSLIDNFKTQYNNERITLLDINVCDQESIKRQFGNLGLMYDIIIEDTTHQFNDQIRVIENVYNYLKPGGVLIIEDIFKSYKESDYINALGSILQHFQDYYFIELDHNNRNSTGWDNDKLFVLIKGGGEPLFKNDNKITIITPSYRTTNLEKIKNSINFDYVHEWIIVYDQTKIATNPELFKHKKIKEYIYSAEGISGNDQRNHALTKITNPDTILYFLDDDNIVHPGLYRLLNIIENDKVYTFNQHNRIKGNNVNIGRIDTAMCMISYKLANGITWSPDKYDADGYYIKEVYSKNKSLHIFVNNSLCYYNKLA